MITEYECFMSVAQTDMFGIIGTVHVLLFGKYMQVYQEAGHWRTTNAFKRWDDSL